MRILIFGDSIAQGFYDRQGGWAQRIINGYNWQSGQERDQANANWVEGYNLGISGDTATGVLGRLQNEFAARQLYKEENILVFAVGTNGSSISHGEPVSTAEEYRSEMEQIADLAIKLAKHTIFVGITSVDDKLCNPWKYSSTDRMFSNQNIKEFDNQVQDMCAQRGLKFVSLFDDFKAGDEAHGWLLDGLHPNEAGHEFIASVVKPEIDKLVGANA
ncbi:MAG: GDSL-type esterase/lipase family protein [Candidatus Saccharimonadales bacterium]